jgi:hypothetical protein
MRCLIPLLLFFSTVPLAAQEAANIRLRIFLDCNAHCDGSFLRTQLTRVDWVSDRTAADVHIIATDLSTGAGGTEVTLEFIGLKELQGLTDRVTFSTGPDATSDEFRREFARVLRLGLIRYLLVTGRADGFTLGESSVDRDVRTVSAADPWKNWIFTIAVDGSLEAESRETGYEVETELRANHVTEMWKVRLALSAEVDRTTFEFEDGEKFTANRDGWYGEALAVHSLGNQWSAGGYVEASSQRTENLDLGYRVAAALEHDLFPYAEATRRRLILLYSVGVNYSNYVEETIFSRLSETRLNQQLDIAYGTQQPWGSAYLNATAFTYLHDWSRNRLSIGGGLGVRLARGLSFDFDASYSRVRDQLSLPKGDATDEEILLELRELATGYRASVYVGLSYTFGSFLNTIVNPRFNDF